MLDEVKRKQVYDILLMPIRCKSGDRIYVGEDMIISGQRYWPYKNYPQNLDEDMSDFTLGFYEIIYQDLLGGKSILNDKDGFTDKGFAGDTMNSYATIANRPSLDSSIEYIDDYRKQYHCLANFWLIPMHIGRTSQFTPEYLKEWSKTSNKVEISDYMDRFLVLYKNNSSKYLGLFPNYFSKLNGIKDFAEKHFLIGSYVSENMKIDNFSDNLNDRKTIVETIQNKIRLRATAISKSHYAEKLWNYFDGNDLIK